MVHYSGIMQSSEVVYRVGQKFTKQPQITNLH